MKFLIKINSYAFQAYIWNIFCNYALALQTVVTVGVGILSVAKMRLTKKYLNNKLAPNNDNKKDRKIERQVFITVAIMQIGFTIAMGMSDLFLFCVHW